jgi:glycosyltransferase involved in cell wall biosynthesis
MKICSWGDIACALNGKTSGGGELQIALLCKALAKSGHEVVIIDFMTKQDFTTDEGIKVLQVKGYDDSIKFFRFFSLIPNLYSSLIDQKADIYYCQIRDFRHLLALWAARKVKGIFVLQLASDLDAMGLRMRMKYDYFTRFEGLYWFTKVFLTELVFPSLVRRADMVLVQHAGQKNILLKKGINSIIFNNLIELDNIPKAPNPVRQDFSYVGALDKRKGFADFYRLVEKAPFATFKVIGQPRDKTGFLYFKKLESFKNVTLFGNLSHSETITHILNSKALISTSPMEGFPNIFVEAWACGIPVLSLSFDPGDVIKREGLGFVADGDLDKLVNAMGSIQNTYEFAQKAKSFVEQNFALNKNKMNEINDIFVELNKKGKKPRI